MPFCGLIVGGGSIKIYNLNDFIVYRLFNSRQIASDILVAIRNKLISSFKVIKGKINDQEPAEIIEIKIWSGNTHFKIYDI